MPVTDIAYAKINLALHVRGRREDGYHDLESLFAFVDNGDLLTARPAEVDALDQQGEFAGAMGLPFGNLAMKALTVLPRATGIEVTLEKNLPVAAGLGGGSADAGAVFRIVRGMYGLPDDWHDRAAKLGADVPACVESKTCIGRGTGTELEAADDSLAGTPVLLVNPREPLATANVFAGWDGKDRGPLNGETIREMSTNGRNDLERPAISLVPVIADVLAALRDTNAWLVRMSGSGATCFALFDSEDERNGVQRSINKRHRDWWTMTGRLR
ncbi:4-(cytidine 5'-diphospho)-2-C-methyl-D-erythritol kinase [Qipengyuania atrilutea]|uniref:4-diphosphocytidyl-2-C-methyl-D-erythritol kinase n=1 Tax=Qipengyuania atrilutea TaxID=2744473 RepID=A0A850GWI1_9SPHN|nr:4-(cytidine 5'-diphospho)-2-C-methyl-D-erythritol kinase [Actirhodobacter atriluteus]NVD43924.1 4-(cytidine 5'-diphospho)-2-C-methyl-D-erythritol kinase [Actirhodobacter atriluteus]